MNAPSPYHPASFSFRLLTEKHVECRDEANTPTTEAQQISKAFEGGTYSKESRETAQAILVGFGAPFGNTLFGEIGACSINLFDI